MPTTYRTPTGQYSPLYYNMAKQPHLLIAGATGSGKSVVINGILHALLMNHSPATCRLILIDPKRVELVQYKTLPHVLTYASEPGEPARALRYAVQIMEDRFSEMQRTGARSYNGSHVYILIDEPGRPDAHRQKDGATTDTADLPACRAARVHLIALTQCPLAKVIPTEIKCNMDARVGLRTRSAQDSRNILGQACCETLPRYGQGYYMTPEGLDRYQLPMIPETMIDALVAYWTSKACVA